MTFGRFTRGARRCVEVAVEEARALGHDAVGDEDLLLGVLAVDEGRSGEALSSLGVSLESAREEAETMFADALAVVGISLDDVARQAGGSFEIGAAAPRRLPFSPRAKEALEGALQEAVRLRHKELTAEHVLLGLFRCERGAAVRVLARLGVPPAAVEERLALLREQASA